MKVVVDCTTGQAQVLPLTDADVQQQQVDQQAGAQAAAAAAAIQNNSAAIQTKLLTALNNNITWLNANPNGATLNAAQTKALVQEVNGLIRLAMGLLVDVSQLNSTAGT